MNRPQASRAAAKAMFVCLDVAPTIEQLDIAQQHFESIARRQACGEWTVGGDEPPIPELRIESPR